jgi:hypothetical protein
VFGTIKDMEVEFRKKKKEIEGTTTRKRKQDKMEEPSIAVPFKKLIFFKYLSYWKTLDTPLAIDVKGKTKDGLKSRMDLVNLGIRHDIHPQPSTQNGNVDLPGVGYNLTKDQQSDVCHWLRGVKVPTGFSSNIKSLVSMKDLIMTNYNSHDYHVMLTVFLPIVIRAIGP